MGRGRQVAQQRTIFARGGRREGAGRKPKGERALVSHAGRDELDGHTPVHVTMHVAPGLPSLRAPAEWNVVVRAITALDASECRVIHVSVQSTHLHLLVEPRDARALTSGMKALSARVAIRWNRLWGRYGPVFTDRFHAEPLTLPRQVRNALVYVLNNARKHGLHAVGTSDPYSSAEQFDGWLDAPGARIARTDLDPAATCGRPSMWLLRSGWKRHGLIGLHEIPGARSRSRTRRADLIRRTLPRRIAIGGNASARLAACLHGSTAHTRSGRDRFQL